MIVCNICGTALPGLQTRCSACSGKGIEKPSPVRNLLTPTQRRGSPDRWAKNYTTPPARSPGSPLAKEHGAADTPLPSTPRHGPYLDVQVTPGADLARVYGTLLDKAVGHPRCAGCTKVLSSDSSIYLPTSAGSAVNSDALCRSCFSNHFSKGSCETCQLPVVGDEKGPHKGAHVKGRGNMIWHAHCFCCKICDLDLYKHDHLLCVKGQPYCPTCYERTLGSSEGSAPPDEVAIPAYSRSHNGRPAPPASRRRFAPPGHVTRTSEYESQPRNLPIPPNPPPTPLRDHMRLVNRDVGISPLVKPQSDDSKGQLKETRGLYRNTVKNLAKRFETPGNLTEDGVGTTPRRKFN